MAVQDRVIAASLARNACIAATVYNRGAIILHVIGATCAAYDFMALHHGYM